MLAAQRERPAAAHEIVSTFTRQFEETLSSNRIDVCVGMWANAAMAFMVDSAGGRLRSVFDRTGVPLICYWLDAPMWAHDGKIPGMLAGRGGEVFRSPRLFHVINNAGTAMEMRRVLGMPNVAPLSYGINPDVFTPHAEATKEFDLVFSFGPGDPAPTALMLEELERASPDARKIRGSVSEGLLPALGEMIGRWPSGLRDSAGELLELMLALQLERRDMPMLLRVDAARAARPALVGAIEHMTTDVVLWSDVTMTLRRVETWERAFTYSFLSRHLKCASFGQGDVDAWGCRGQNLGHVAWDEQARAYSRGWIGLNVMRWQDDVGLNVKPYEITASGAALLCEHRTGLNESFTIGVEALEFCDPADALKQAREVLAQPERLRAIADAGRARTLSAHTWSRVAAKMVGMIPAGVVG